MRRTRHFPVNPPNHPHPNHRPNQQRPRHRPAGVVLPEQFEESEECGGTDGGAEPEGSDGNTGEHGDGDQAQLHHQLGGDAQQQHAGQQHNADEDQHAHGNGRALRALTKWRPWGWGCKGCPPVFLVRSCCMFLPSVSGVFLIHVIGISRRQTAATVASLTATPCRSP